MEVMCCMMCGKEVCDQPAGSPEEDEYGNWWTYCRKCDTWTSHPPGRHDAETKHTQPANAGKASDMTRCSENNKRVIAFEHGSRYVCFNWHLKDGLDIFVRPHNMPPLTTKQARQVGDRIIEWCDKAEGK